MTQETKNQVLEILNNPLFRDVEKRWIFDKSIKKKEREAMITGYKQTIKDLKTKLETL